MKTRSSFSLLACLVLASFCGAMKSQAQPFTNTVTALENQKPGTPGWQLSNAAQNSEIEGYASLTSVGRGGQISFFVNTTNSTFVLEVFRVGWYGGAGARRVLGPLTQPGTRQPAFTTATNTHLVECNWTNAYTLNIPATPGDPTDWASGAYLVRLTGGQDGKQNFIIFTVRDDARASDLLFQMSYTTYQAYNAWGGWSLYNGGTIVSFNRPYGSPTAMPAWKGCGDFWEWECSQLRWLEREGYDVTYCSSIDTHTTTNLLWSHKAFLSVGHDEYWSYPMRWNVKGARDRGVNLGILSANTCFWQVRFEPGTADGAPNRNMVCYKSTFDPVFNTSSNYLTTVQFRSFPVLDPESSLLGVYFDYAGVNSDLVVSDPSHWIFAGTGVTNGQRLPGLLGYEVDSTNIYSPPGMQVACTSQYLQLTGPGTYGTGQANVASYTTSSGSTVLAAGTMQFGWGLDEMNVSSFHQSCQSPVAAQIARNIFARMLNQPAPGPNFLFRADTSTLGNWRPFFGGEGCFLPNDSTNLPAYASLNVTGATMTNFLTSSGDARAVQRSTTAGRYLAGWSSPTSFTMDLNLTDGANHLVAFYFWDWNQAGRTQMVEVLDASTMNLLDRRTIGGFAGGQWWSWQINGHVLFRFTNLTGPDCLVNAMMFGIGSAAVFVGEDSVTQGNWKPYYGADGQALVGSVTRNPIYGSITGQGGVTNWPFSSQDPRAYEIYGATNRVFASIGFAASIDVFSISLTDNAWHQLAVYCVDGDRGGRKETLTLISASDNRILDSRSMTNFGEGKYLVWNIRGSVRLHIQNRGVYISAISGIFLGPPNQPPAVSLANIVDGQEFNLPTNIVLNANATDPDDYVTQVSFFTNGVLLATVTNPPFNFVWTNAMVGRYDISALAWDSRRANSASPVTSIFVDPPSGYQTPTIQIDAPVSGSTIQLPTNLVVSASTVAPSAPIVSVQFQLDGAPYGAPVTSPPYAMTVTNLYAGTHSFRAVALDAFGVVVTSPGDNISTVEPSANTAFRDGDPTASGGWIGKYGSDGYLIVNYSTNLPPYATAAPVGNNSYVWANSTTDPRALQKPNAGDHFAGSWSTYTNYVLDVNLVDGNPHRVTLYCLDWFNQGGLQTIQVQDAVSGATLDSRTISNFNNGLYLVWDLVGHVRFRFTRTGGYQASLTGVFFDPPRSVPQINLFAPLDGSSVSAPANVQLMAYAFSGLTNLSRVEFRANGVLLGADTSGSPYSYVWTNPPPGAYTLTARAIDLSGSNAVSSRVSLTVEAVSAAARFVSSDSSQQGSWAGVYGAQGYFIAGDSTNQPAYVAVNNSLPLLTWASFTTDPRAMQHAAGDDRIAAAWYGYSNIVVDVRFSDTSYHRLSLYCLNWYNASGAETVDVVDNVTGAVLDHQLVPPFANGVYETWDLRGHVRLVISRSGSAPACFSGVFLDAAGVLPPVAITNIVQQTIFAAGANISVIADAAADPNNVTRVDFYDGATFLGTAPSGPPYAFVWTNASIGQHTLVAREVGPGGSTNSAPMALSVLGANTTSFMNSTLLPNGGLQLNAFGPVGKPVVVWYATNLGPTAVWLPLLTNVPAANRFSINISDPAFYPRRYYRISSAQ